MRSNVARGYVGVSLCVCVGVWVLRARLRPIPKYGIGRRIYNISGMYIYT
jgi:hypothetical protein